MAASFDSMQPAGRDPTLMPPAAVVADGLAGIGPDGRPVGTHDGSPPSLQYAGQLGFKDLRERQLARALGWFSIGLGLAELLAPRGVAGLIGLRTERTGLLRVMGLREITSGVGILTGRQPGGWLWSRVAGDGLDLAMLTNAMRTGQNDRGRLAFAMIAVAGVAALDMIASQNAARHPRAVPGREADEGAIPVEHAVTVNAPPEECWRAWRDFSRLPTFMKHLESVTVLDERRSHWVARAPAGRTVEWDAEVVSEQPGRHIEWRSLPGADVDNAGRVSFERAHGDRGTVVRARFQYRPPGGAAGAMVAMLFGEEPNQQAHNDLRRFKQLMELGEIPFNEGQPHGRRSALSRIAHKVNPA